MGADELTTLGDAVGLPEEFLAHLSRARPPLCPAIVTFEARALVPLWEEVERIAGAGAEPPYWGWSWPGSQALARYLLDHSAAVRGLSVLDLGAGNGLASVAARIAGARRAVANDVDPTASRMAERVAAANGVSIETETLDRLSSDLDGSFDVVLVGDLFYSSRLASRAERWLRRAREAGCSVLIGEPGRDYALRSGVTELARYRLRVPADLETVTEREARVLALEPTDRA